MNRRKFLQAAGVSLALPWFEAHAKTAPAPRRMMFICAPLGIHPPNFFPEKAGRDYALTPYLEPLKDLRPDFTVVSGLHHPQIAADHDSLYSFLTGAHHVGFMRAGFRNTISVDQLAAEHIVGQTRFASLALTTEGGGLSYTRSGVLVPSSNHPSWLFGQLFFDGGPEQVEQELRRLRQGKSILDHVREPAKKLESGLGATDKEKLDEYLTSVRELEQRLTVAQEWAKKPKPKVTVPPPTDPPNADILGRTRAWFDLIHLVLQTDSSRLATMVMIGGSHGVPTIPGVTHGHHDLSHHGQDPKKLEELRIVELGTMKVFGDFLRKLKATKEEGETLLDRTQVFLGSNLGNGSNHATRNLPVLLAGGGFKHGNYMAFDQNQTTPLCNLFVSMLQRMGLPIDKFGSSTGTLTGLAAK